MVCAMWNSLRRRAARAGKKEYRAVSDSDSGSGEEDEDAEEDVETSGNSDFEVRGADDATNTNHEIYPAAGDEFLLRISCHVSVVRCLEWCVQIPGCRTRWRRYGLSIGVALKILLLGICSGYLPPRQGWPLRGPAAFDGTEQGRSLYTPDTGWHKYCICRHLCRWGISLPEYL